MTGGAGSSGSAAGAGGVGGAGADGGAVTITSIDAHNATDAAVGANVTLTAGAGGNAGVNTASNDGGAAGAGGLAVATFENSSTPDFATLTLTAGAGGNGGNAADGNTSIVGGVAGTAIVTVGSGAAEATTINVTAGAGGNSGNTDVDESGGAGKAGGVATLTLDGTLTGQGATGATTINIAGGNGGNGGNAGTGAVGVDGLAGGVATVDFGGSSSSANIVLNDGEAGTAGTANGANAGGAAGAGGGAVVAYTAAHTLTGTITAASDNEGDVTTAGGKLTVVGSIGSSSADLDAVTLGHAGGLDIDGNLYAKDVVLNIAGAQLNFGGTALQTVSAAISAGAGGTEDLTMGANAIVTFKNYVGSNSAGTANALVDVTTSAGSTVKFEKSVKAATLTLNATGTTTFEDAVTLTGALAVANGSTVTLGAGITAGETVFTSVTGGSSFTTAATVNLPQTFTSGVITLVDDSGATAAADALLLTLNSNVLANYSAAANASDTGKLDITATRKSSSAIASALGINAQAAVALDNAATALATGDAVALTALNTALVAGGTTAANATEQMVPDTGAGAAAASASVGAVSSVIGGRQSNTTMASNHFGTAKFASNARFGESGISTGDAADTQAVWGQLFGTNATQDAKGGVDGYDADTGGLVLGWETEMGKDSLGGSLSYSDTGVDGKSAANSKTDSQSWMGTVYGTTYSTDSYTDWMIAYADGDNSSKRTINFGGLNRTASANYDSDTVMVKVGYGEPMTKGNWMVTPKSSLSWTRVSTEGYTETGAGGLNLIVNSADHDLVTLSAGADFATRIERANGVTIPRISVMGNYDVTNDRVQSTSTFTGGGTAFTTQGIDPEKFGLGLGMGVDFESNDNETVFSVDYNGDLKSGFDSHTASITLRKNF